MLKKKLGPSLSALLVALIAYVILFILLSAAVAPERYDLNAGEVSPITVTASKDVEDTFSTQKLIDEAMRAVQPSYVSDASVQPAVLAKLQEGFNRLLQMKSRMAPVAEEQNVTEEELLQAANAMQPAELPDEALSALIHADAETMTTLYERTFALLRETLSGKLPQGQELTPSRKFGATSSTKISTRI